jgi:hypothetical protein
MSARAAQALQVGIYIQTNGVIVFDVQYIKRSLPVSHPGFLPSCLSAVPRILYRFNSSVIYLVFASPCGATALRKRETERRHIRSFFFLSFFFSESEFNCK